MHTRAFSSPSSAEITVSVTVVTKGRGRPECGIDQMQLTFLVEQGFKIKDIAKIFNCSRRTIERRMSKYCIEGKIFSSLTDDELDQRLMTYVH